MNYRNCHQFFTVHKIGIELDYLDISDHKIKFNMLKFRNFYQTNGLVSAQEVACFVYCPEQWRLQHGLGLPPENGAVLAAGTRHHARNTATERVAGCFIALGRVAVSAAAVLLLLWALRRWT